MHNPTDQSVGTMNQTEAEDASPDTKTRILESAAAVFARKGYHDTRMDDIVAESGASKGGIYFHWPSKEKIFLALVDSFGDLLEGRLRERLSAAPGGLARLDEALAICVETFGRYRLLAKVAFVQASGLGMSFERKRQSIGDRFIAIIKENLETAAGDGSIPPLDAELAAHVWMGALNEIVMRWIQNGTPDAAASLPALRTILLRSVGVADVRHWK